MKSEAIVCTLVGSPFLLVDNSTHPGATCGGQTGSRSIMSCMHRRRLSTHLLCIRIATTTSLLPYLEKMSERSSKRKRPDWKNLPAFLDSSASVSATTFGARRLPELKALWNAQPESSATADQKLQSNGGKTSSRHLRRRTTSHLPRRRHRYPRGKPESGANHSNKRPCRRARRKPALLRQQHETWKMEMHDTISADRVFWLTTHLWHAKRFHMHDNLFGWKVPLVHANRGARAALRMASEQHTLVQDVTWRMATYRS